MVTAGDRIAADWIHGRCGIGFSKKGAALKDGHEHGKHRKSTKQKEDNALVPFAPSFPDDENSPYFIERKESILQTISLLAFPYAGGSSSAYYSWKKELAPFIRLVTPELSGRGTRINEPLYENMDELLVDLFPRVQDEIQAGPYVLFGHSFGSLIAYELAHRLREEGAQAPLHVIVSGRKAAHLPGDSTQWHQLDDHAFMEKVFQLGGTPEAVLKQPALLELIIPVLKKDYRVVETYRHPPHREPLDCTITALYGIADNHMTRDEVQAWMELTSAGGNVYAFEGGHFFIHSDKQAVLSRINTTLAKLVSTDS
jgi:medium-chain acyl-[acyl-carrier-protein] hydrolase